MKKLVAIFLVLALLLAGCQSLLGGSQDNTGAVQTAVQQTVQQQDMMGTFIAQTMSVAAVPATAVPVIATAQPTVAPTQELPTATVVPVAAVEALANENANCRLGPAKNFDYVEAFKAGSTADVIAVNTEFGKWWQLSLADGKKCWVIDGSVTITGDQSKVAMVDSPATPTPVPPPSWAGNWILYSTNGNFAEGFNVSSMPTTIVQKGNELSFAYSGWNMNFTSSGTLSADGLIFNGYEGGSYGWTSQLYFVMDPNNPNQFRGKWYTKGSTANDGWFCGSRNGAPMPDPCRN